MHMLRLERKNIFSLKSGFWAGCCRFFLLSESCGAGQKQQNSYSGRFKAEKLPGVISEMVLHMVDFYWSNHCLLTELFRDFDGSVLFTSS